MTDSPPIDPEPAGYVAAVEELEAILAEIEDDTVDIDRLGEQVARAAELLRWCRARLRTATDAVEAAAADLVD